VTSDGRHSSNTAACELTVLPRWWQNRWIQGGGLAAVLVALLLGIRWREKSFSRIQLRLETAVADRTRELQEANRRLGQLAVTDELTGLPNRRSILHTVEAQISNARRKDKSLAVAMIDIDHFKQVNDRFGHEAGDGALMLVVKAMESVLRAPDFLGRLGGDEFLLIMPDTETRGGMRAGERLRESVEKAAEASGRDAWAEVRITIGIAELHENEDGVKSFLARADEALYAAKAAGRNTVASV